MFLIFKQYYMYFHTLFTIYILRKKTENYRMAKKKKKKKQTVAIKS